MSRKQRHRYILDKSIQAVISGIEVYNKPDFKYREESFSILMVNAWELLCKARVVQLSNNSLKSIFAIDYSAKRKDGTPFKNVKFKKNRAGNYYTVDIFTAMSLASVDKVVKDNIELLVEIRDNSVHFINDSHLLEKKVLEIGTASLKSYVTLVKEWFNFDLSKYNFYLMPISFFHAHELESFSINDEDDQHKNLLEYIAIKEKEHPSSVKKKHNISLILETKFVRSSSMEGLNIKYDNDSDNQMKIIVTAEEQFRNKYPLNWTDNIKPLIIKEIPDVKFNNKFWTVKKELEKDSKLCGERPLDWNKPNKTKKTFYSANFVKELKKKLKL